MSKILNYVYDPLCGWCYGATPAVSDLLEIPGIRVELLPSGLFSGERARPMDDDFARFAWSNDQRIQRLTGQCVTEHYREKVLGDRQQLFDSGPATVALTAVSITDPSREFYALKAIQHARYAEGRDVTSLATLADLLKVLGLQEAAAMMAQPDAALLDANRARVAQAQALIHEFGAGGVPTFISESDAKRSLLDSGAAYSNPRRLLDQLQAA
ncbi:MAG: DsbA family protein [Pseudomonadota bacterium]|nr:DsbA family protein [Pseudomonadota bacterium]